MDKTEDKKFHWESYSFRDLPKNIFKDQKVSLSGKVSVFSTFIAFSRLVSYWVASTIDFSK